MKVVINSCFGDFSLSLEAAKELKKRECLAAKEAVLPGEEYSDETKRTRLSGGYCFDISRTDENLISLIEEWGSERVSGKFAKLKIVEIPDDIRWEIDEYGGYEVVDEVHRSWY